MSALDKAITILNVSTVADKNVNAEVDARSQIIITIAYLCFLLSVPLDNLQQLVWYAVFPILWSTLSGIGYSQIFVRSLVVLPLIAFIGIFNPIMDHTVVFTVSSVEVTRGWLTFISIIIRGLLSVQAVILLIMTTGFYPMCLALSSLGVPSFLVTQLLLLYRYMIVLLEELQRMQRARASRGYGQKLPLKMWGVMIGQLFIRTVNRADRIHQAMLSRGFDGVFRLGQNKSKMRTKDFLWIAVWILAFIFLRMFNVAQLLHFQ